MLRHHDKGRSHLTPKQLVCRVNAFDIESFAIYAVPDSPARLKLNNVLTSHTPWESVSPPSRVSTAVGFRRKAPARRCAAKRALRGVEAQRARGRFPVALFPVKVAREASQPAERGRRIPKERRTKRTGSTTTKKQRKRTSEGERGRERERSFTHLHGARPCRQTELVSGHLVRCSLRAPQVEEGADAVPLTLPDKKVVPTPFRHYERAEQKLKDNRPRRLPPRTR